MDSRIGSTQDLQSFNFFLARGIVHDKESKKLVFAGRSGVGDLRHGISSSALQQIVVKLLKAEDMLRNTRDAAAFADHPGVDAVLVPKVSTPADLDAVAAVVPGKPLWAMMETALGMLNAAQIAAHPALQGMVMGTNDLALP